ncbi:MAG TPA: LapA family protein [Streptosporangiaceae bacterium]|nr:LapA family protein [Streptosporangiaceae bacterium]
MDRHDPRPRIDQGDCIGWQPRNAKAQRHRPDPGSTLAGARLDRGGGGVHRQNRQRVSIDLFSARVTSPLWLILVITFLVGMFIGMLATRRRAKRTERR